MPEEIINIDDHFAQAVDRLPDQYRHPLKVYAGNTQSGWDGLLNAFTKNAQSMEDIMQSMLDQRGLETAEGVNLDKIGQIVGAERRGVSDVEYLKVIKAKLLENISDATFRDILAAAKIFVDVDDTTVNELFPAKFNINYLNIASIDYDRVVDSINAAKGGGIGFFITQVPSDPRYFAFASPYDIWENYAFAPLSGLTATDRIFPSTNGTEKTLSLYVADDARGDQFYADLVQAYSVSLDGVFQLRDKAGVTWRLEYTPPVERFLVDDLGNTLVDDLGNELTDDTAVSGEIVESNSGGDKRIDFLLTFNAGTVDSFAVYKNQVLSNVTTLYTEFSPFTDADHEDYLTLNGDGIYAEVVAGMTDAFANRGGFSSYYWDGSGFVTVDIGAGQYSNLLTGA